MSHLLYSLQNLGVLTTMVVLFAASLAHGQAQVRQAPVARLGRPDPDSPDRMMLLRVQIFLDRALFRPGKLDGLGGEFTQKAADKFCAAYKLPAGTLLDVSSVTDVYTTYTVSAEDMAWVGRMASGPAQQSRLKSMPYATVHELVAERYHTELEFIEELNPHYRSAGVGTVFKVPNVTPFVIHEVRTLEQKRAEEKRQQEALQKHLEEQAKLIDPGNTSRVANTGGAELQSKSGADAMVGQGGLPASSGTGTGLAPSAQRSAAGESSIARPSYRIEIDRAARMLDLYENKQLIASFPCTPGSARVPVPAGEWKITSNILLPVFRYDKSVLQSGVRSSNFYNIPPGPNNYVGIVWMGINRRSVGIHGTMTPDAIGRNESSGCIRLANWDAWELCKRVVKDTPVFVK